MTGTYCSAFGGAPIPEAGGAPIQSLAPVVGRITPGVVGIAVRGRVRDTAFDRLTGVEAYHFIVTMGPIHSTVR